MPNFERLRSPFIPVVPLFRLAANITQNGIVFVHTFCSFCESLCILFLLPHVIFPTTSDLLSCALQFVSQAHQPSHRHCSCGPCTLRVLVNH